MTSRSPLPGQHAGDGYASPGNSRWRWDKDGKVHYPLTLRRVIVERPVKVPHVNSWAPVERPAIDLDEVVVAE